MISESCHHPSVQEIPSGFLTKAVTLKSADQRSYELATEDGTFRRNWKDLILLPDSTTTNTSSDDLNMKDSTDSNTTDSDIIDPVYCLSTRPAILLEFPFSHTSILALLMSNNTKIKQVLWIA